ncbi:hypothetical protein [Amycolatopsis sp. PS_44_ISF1]|uniref:hypothetical protein n=1 Tax=Amycolatopsis sp. PS_44_ISF1 TaxID=2974917 RepID=UPI0028DFE797|nr:hypothetical protein [Amycolatopsis sp. PS_44_ISF1]MDT8913290.1 hypothetical protein [Amycolatopsis sp. PS_44_ISF1]
MLDDAAVFPPGLAPLPDAVAAHRAHEAAWYGGLVGPLVIAASALGALAEVVRAGGDPAAGPVTGAAPLRLALTFPGGPATVAEALEASAALPVSVEALEIAVPDGMEPGELPAALDAAVPATATAEVFVEIPRDARRDPLLAALAGTRYRAKFRTGGVRAELYPDEAELAAAVRAAVGAGVAFKATAGLHHAVRATDPDTGFEQHGFLNLLLATEAAAAGAGEAALRDLLSERDGAVVARRIRELGPERVAAARARFTSFGTCSVTDPLTELAGLGLLTEPPGAA